jgi:RimJ/RimL family protein N-acetyltransferase
MVTEGAAMSTTGTRSNAPGLASETPPTSATLVDGATVTLRQLGPGDYDALVELALTLTEQERYLRFFTMRPAGLDQWARALASSNDDQYVLGVFEDDSLIATANYVMTTQPGYAEVSVVVAHLQHDRGIGTAVLKLLGITARRRGIHHFVADVLAENHPLRKVVVDAGWPCTWHRDGAVFSIDLDLDAFASADRT